MSGSEARVLVLLAVALPILAAAFTLACHLAERYPEHVCEARRRDVQAQRRRQRMAAEAKARAARDNARFDQQGRLSPAILADESGRVSISSA